MYPAIIVTPSLSIPTYYLILSLTICISLVWLARRSDHFELSRKVALDLSLIIMICGFLGGRLFHVFYEEFEYYRQDPLKVLEFWNGGFVYYGGALFAALGGIIYLYFKVRPSLEKYLDLVAPVLSLSYALGRIACLFAGCCYGKYCELPWAISGRHPTQLYASIWEFGSLIILLGLERAKAQAPKDSVLAKDGAVFYLWIILHGLGRLLMESYRDDFRGPSLGLSISSWISILIILFGSYFLAMRPKTVKGKG